MLKNIKILGICLSIMLFGIIGIGILNQLDSPCDDSIYLNNVGATKCWKATCGHKSKSYTYPAYNTSRRYTQYYHGGTYLDPGVSETVSISKTVSQSINISAGVDGKVAKASVGYTGGKSISCSRSQTMKNEKKYRRYPHLGVEFADRNNNVTIKKRTYDPAWHLKETNKYCKFSTTVEKQSCKVKVAVGLSLLDNIKK